MTDISDGAGTPERPSHERGTPQWVSVDTQKHSTEGMRCHAFLSQRVRGQDRAIDATVDAYEAYLSGKTDPKHPLCVHVHLGPPGTGKTELVRAFTEFLFGKDSAMTRIDAQEYSNGHEVARLTGSPPGYVRSEELPILAQERLDYPGWEALYGSRYNARIREADRLVGLLQMRSRSLEELEARQAHLIDREDLDPQDDEFLTLLDDLKQAKEVLEETFSQYTDIVDEIRMLMFRPGAGVYLSVLLIDEVERGHSKLHNVCLRIMDEARVTVSVPQDMSEERSSPHERAKMLTKESETTFQWTFIFFTSNVGSDAIEALLRGSSGLGFRIPQETEKLKAEDLSQKIYEVAIAAFRKEFRSPFRRRVDEVIVFRPFSEETRFVIFQDKIQALQYQFLQEEKLSVVLENAVVEYFLSDIREHPDEGAGLINKKIESRLRRPLRRALNTGELQTGDTVMVTVSEGGKFAFAYDVSVRENLNKESS